VQDDGSIDSDFEEVLKSTQFIKNFGSCFFIRCGAASVNLCSRPLTHTHHPLSVFTGTKEVAVAAARESER
jgi:hypothetical protein